MEVAKIAAANAAAALVEDQAGADLLKDLATDADVAHARIYANEACVLAGAAWVEACIRQCSKSMHDCIFDWKVQEGACAQAGEQLVAIKASAQAILAAERSALNFLGLLAATATAAKLISQAAAPIPVYTTRKTVPQLRAAQIYAAQIGGMHANRAHLAEAAIIKDNHIRTAGSVAVAFAKACKSIEPSSIQIEVADLDELAQALEAGATRIMLDNFSVEQVQQAAATCAGRKIELEASGSITAANAAAYAAAGATRLSSSIATKNAGCIDLSMRFDPA